VTHGHILTWKKFRYCLSRGANPDGWTGLPGTVFDCVVCMFILLCGCLSPFDIIIIIVVVVVVVVVVIIIIIIIIIILYKGYMYMAGLSVWALRSR
jgi:hypothetical protein